ncbi:ABC transporter ATP-binding protein [Sandaracinobacteroides sp. A072]|uniref:ABC transporter ATP-binding protein n=1 Tax=Sandaracinobacteroides sp. A072 TaxID=3461146 RepID=UPI0040438D45
MKPASIWTEVLRLVALMDGWRWRLVLLIGFGVAAAFAETLGIGLAVMFLFTILGDPRALDQVEGPLARLFTFMSGSLDAQPDELAIILFLLILLSAGLIYAHGVLTTTMSNLFAERMRDLVHERYVTVGYRWLQEREQGALVHTLTTETWLAAEAFDHLARIAVHICAIMVFGFGLLFLSWEITLTAGLSALFMFLALRLLFKPIRRIGQRLLAENQLLAERMLVSLHGMRTIRAFAQERHVLDLFGKASSRVRALAVRVERLKALNGPIGEIGSLGTLVVIAAVAGRAGVDVPTIIASALLLFRMQPHLRGIETKRLALANISPSLVNLHEMIRTEDKCWPTEGTKDFSGLARGILFEAVSFSHDARRPDSLHEAGFEIPAGRITALAGPSGSGKSTIINLLLRLYEPQSGRILVDGEDLLSIRRESWLSRIAIAGQDVELVEGTVVQNIRLANHAATDSEVREACALVEILDDIEAIPEGLDARIGPGGLSFSGGQRQRLGLARALVRKPDILILDEAMSALEPALEERIRERITALMAGKTMLVVSHRADALSHVDHVVRIKAGRIQRTEPKST